MITVCTGAGIAPALPHIEQRTSDILLIWIAKVRLPFFPALSPPPSFTSLNYEGDYIMDPMLTYLSRQNHRKTYGETVWSAVMSNLPSSQVILHDTGKMGRPDIGSLIERAAKMHDAEAVFVVVSHPFLFYPRFSSLRLPLSGPPDSKADMKL